MFSDIVKARYSAKQTAALKGHQLTRFKALHETSYYAECRKCKGYVYVSLFPFAGNKQISGTAVTDNCE